jgi:hypothetical protein
MGKAAALPYHFHCALVFLKFIKISFAQLVLKFGFF